MTKLAGALPDPRLLHRLRVMAWVVRAMIVAAAIALTGSQAWYWSSPRRALELVRPLAGEVLSIDTQAHVLGILCSLVPLGVLLMALLRLWNVFGEYARGRVFSRHALVSLRGFARWLLVAGFVSPLYGALLSVVVTWGNGPGRRQLMLQLGSNDYEMLLFGLVVLAISTVMVEAARVAEDNEGFV